MQQYKIITRSAAASLAALLFSFALTACKKQAQSSTVQATQKPQKVIFALDWTPNTNHTGLYVAQKLGYFDDAGLKVDIVMPEHSVAKLVASGRADFGIRAQQTITTDIANEGIPIISIAAVLQHNTSGFSFLNSKNIQRPADFAGKIYGGWNRDLEKTMIPYLIKQDGGDPSTLQMTLLGDSYIAALINDKIDFTMTYYGWENIDFKLKGLDVGFLATRDIEPIFDTYTPVIIGNSQRLTETAYAKTATKFIQAVAKGYAYTAHNPEKAAKILLEYAPELDRELVQRSQRYLTPYYLDENGNWGIQKTEVWQRFGDWAYEQKLIDNKIDSTKAMTNRFIEKS